MEIDKIMRKNRKKGSEGKALKRHLKELEREVTACSDPVIKQKLTERVEKMRTDLEERGYIHRRVPLKSTPKKIRHKKIFQGVDPLLKARDNIPKGSRISMVQGGKASGK